MRGLHRRAGEEAAYQRVHFRSAFLAEGIKALSSKSTSIPLQVSAVLPMMKKARASTGE
jgi:hypothetical protein